MKNTFFIIMTILTISLLGYFLFFQGNLATGKTILSTGEAQIVKLSVENGKYILSPNELKKNIPVRIEADISKMPGCSKSILIPSFNVQKNLNSKSNIIEFTPDKAGTFNIMCSMNMYRGTFTVLENDGTKSNYVEKASTSGGSCGAGGGGCGCGG